MEKYLTNQERTSEYLQIFDREKTINYLIKERQPFILDVGANVGTSLDEFKSWSPDASVHCFEQQQECWDALEQRFLQRIATDNDMAVNFQNFLVANRLSSHAWVIGKKQIVEG
jgi:hypothetical protein